MPTQEERLTTVEYDLKQFKTEPIKAYSEMAMELIMIKGLTEDTVKRLMIIRQDIGEIKTTLSEHTALLTQILARLPENPKP